MRLITLNIWGGKVYDPLLKFVDSNKDSVDFFCFQEVYKSDRSVITPGKFRSNILGELGKILVDFDSFFSPLYHGRDFFAPVDYPLSHGSAIFWKKNFKPIDKGAIFVYRKENDVGYFEEKQKADPPKHFQYLVFDNFLIINFHGFWEPAPKYDTPQRFRQTEIFLGFIAKYKKPKIAAGDFNLSMDTQSITLIEKKLINLVREFRILTTRSLLYDEKYRLYDKFADYIFVSKDVKVKHFEVMKDEVSDHLPLSLEFEI